MELVRSVQIIAKSHLTDRNAKQFHAKETQLLLLMVSALLALITLLPTLSKENV